eukprot:7207155-Prymnesium_polylepis.1
MAAVVMAAAKAAMAMALAVTVAVAMEAAMAVAFEACRSQQHRRDTRYSRSCRIAPAPTDGKMRSCWRAR